MQTHYILTADDFGPIDFINKGVYDLVQKGILNSIQVIVNNDSYQTLVTKLIELGQSVPEGKIIDIGIHYTLTSGSPMHTKGLTNKEISQAWGDMVTLKEGQYVFTKSSKFDHDYRSHLKEIRKELEFQKDFLITAYEDALKVIGSDKIVFTSASNHHNYFTIAPDIFLIYQEVSFHHNGYPLSIRSPKALPSKRARTYYGLVSRIFNRKSSREFRKIIRNMNENFSQNLNYLGTDISIKSSSYTDIGFYRTLGSLRAIDLFDLLRRNAWNHKRNSRQKAIIEMMSRSTSYELVPERDPEDLKIVEFVFHVGALSGDQTRKNVKNKDYRRMAIGYHGITHKYFDDRLVEANVLEHLKKSEYTEGTVFPFLISWDRCGNIIYKGSKHQE